MDKANKIHRYDIPSLAGEGWAIVVLTEDGLFAADSDFGGCARLWRRHGSPDFRRFVLALNEQQALRKLFPDAGGDHDAVNFTTKVLPRLKKAIRRELAAEDAEVVAVNLTPREAAQATRGELHTFRRPVVLPEWFTDEYTRFGAEEIHMELEPFGGRAHLWCREWWLSLAHGRGLGVELHYQADGHDPAVDAEAREKHRRILDVCPDQDIAWRPESFGAWRAPIEMPVWASRRWLRVVKVRAEQDDGKWWWAVDVEPMEAPRG